MSIVKIFELEIDITRHQINSEFGEALVGRYRSLNNY